MSESASITGRWRITAMDNWDQEAIDLVQPGFVEFGEDGLGSLGFTVVTGELDCRDADRDGQPGVEFSWQGSDEGDDASGRGWAALNPDGTLVGHIYFHLGDTPETATRRQLRRPRHPRPGTHRMPPYLTDETFTLYGYPIATVTTFADPLAAGAVHGRTWNPATRTWQAP
jgi:hypothetical protein